MLTHMYAEIKSRAHAGRYSPLAPTLAGAETRFAAGEEGVAFGWGGRGGGQKGGGSRAVCGYDFIILKLRAQPR